MKNSIIVYFPYELKDMTTGSSVRPNKIIKAFENFCEINNYNLIKISGNSAERKAQFKKLKEVSPNSILYCYMENATLPIWLTDSDKFPRTYIFEEKFMKYLKKNNIPLGMFYRDIYWKFKEYYPLKGFLLFFMKFIYNKELNLFNSYVNYKYLPSLSMNEYTGFKGNVKSLPPAISKFRKQNNFNKKRIIYVGSLNPNSGLNILIRLSELIHENNLDYKLLIICPKQNVVDYSDYFGRFLSNTEVQHGFGEELEKFYFSSSIAIIPREKNIYNDFAMPIKLFEYLSYSLPIISTNVNETSKFIKENNYGFIFNDEQELIKILLTLENEKNYNNILKSIINTFHSHTWESRVKEIHNDLIGLNKYGKN